MQGAAPGLVRTGPQAARVPRSVRAIRVPLHSELTPTDVLRAAGADAFPVALVGRWAGGGALVGSDPLALLDGLEDPFAALECQPEVIGAKPDTVGGGWIGYLGYGLGAPAERRPAARPRPPAAPRFMLGFYDHLLRYDGTRWFFEALWSHEQATRLGASLDRWRKRLVEPPAKRLAFRAGSFSWHPRPPAHLLAVSRAIEHIRAGDVYQVNVCGGFRGELAGDALEAWCRGAERLLPAYGAYLGYPDLTVASFSPELFLRRRDSRVLTSPIKGTAGLGDQGLATSAKDRAENVMIVDLMRNDLGRVCRFGRVAVTDLCRLESHPGVCHLVSDIVGELRSGVDDAELLRATFPPGSVTGAPKVAAMGLITTLESSAREVYTGCIGIASPVSGLELNVAIRTFEIAHASAWLGVGGGVVADSDPAAELGECFAKASPLIRAIGGRIDPFVLHGKPRGPTSRGLVARARNTPDPALGVFETLLILKGRPVALEAHLARLATSVAALYGSRLPPGLGAEVLEEAARTTRQSPHRLRILATPASGKDLELALRVEPVQMVLGPQPGPPASLVTAELAGGLGEHKWQDRRILADRRPANWRPQDQLLLVEPDGTVLEAERANLFGIFGDVLRTPPADGRILAGTTRDQLLRLAGCAGMGTSQEPLKITHLESADEVLLTSSVSGILPVTSLGTRTWRTAGHRTAALTRLLWRHLGSQTSLRRPVLSS